MRHNAHLICGNALLVDTDDQGRIALVKVVSGDLAGCDSQIRGRALLWMKRAHLLVMMS